jgi:iron complex transport system substrate-binding protein
MITKNNTTTMIRRFTTPRPVWLALVSGFSRTSGGHRGRSIFVVFLLFVTTMTWPAARATPAANASAQPARIISLIPAVTEMLFAMGAGSKIVAVSSFDEYPPQVKALPRVGALLDPDLERILSLRPDLVIVYKTQVDLRRQLERATIPMFLYEHASLADISVTIRQLGTRVGHDTEAAGVVRQIDDKLADVRKRIGARPRVRTMLVYGRDALALRGIYASGGVNFLNDMLDIAGAANVFADVKQKSVQATSELILARRPDAIVELRPGEMSDEQRQKEIAVWRTLSSLPAVRSGRVTIITDPRVGVPGPRVAEGTELLARTIHPEAFAK